MTIRKHLNNLLNLFNEPLSVIELAEAECLPPVLHISNIALLMYTDSKKLQEAFEIMLKGLININILPVITVEEYTNLAIEHERQRDATNYKEPLPPGHLPQITVIAVAHQDTDLLDSVAELNTEQRRMFVVHRNDMKKWLESENEWPLPQGSLLSRWWPDSQRKNRNAEVDITSRSKEDNYFRLEKDYWKILFRGRPYAIKQSIGMQYIAHLIQRSYNEESEIHVSDLFYQVKGRPAAEDTELSRLTKVKLAKIGLDVAGLGDAGDIMTPAGKEQIIKQVRILKRKIEEAQNKGQGNLALRLREDKEDLEDHMKKALGFSNRLRKASDANERIRKTVCRSIDRALEKIGKKEGDELAVYLADHIDKGLFCSFRKDPEIDWKIFM